MNAERKQYRGWNEPMPATLKKYGGSLADWRAVIDRQGGVCPICQRVPTTGRGVIDHEHARGWKDMSPALRWAHVRGVTCWFDNHSFLGRGITAEKSSRVTRYLLAYALRRTRGR